MGFSCAFEEHLDGKTWTAPDDMASEHETGEFIYGLLRLIKPHVSIETGCYRGDTSLQIAKAMKTNGLGRFLTCDTDKELCNIVENRIRQCQNSTVFNQRGVELCKAAPVVDFAFLDSSGDRHEEAQALNLSQGAIVILHDARRPVFADVLSLGWKHLFIPTPRGIAIFQK